MCGHDINRPNLGFHNYNRSNVNSHDYNRLYVDSHEYKPNVDRHDNNRLNVNSHDNNWPNFGGHNYQRSNVDNHDNRSSGHNQSKNILNSSFDKSRSVISDKDNYRIIRNPWSDVNNNIFYQDKNGVRSRNRENHDNDRYRKHAFSSRGPHDRENWRDESNKRENQPRPHHDNSTKKNTGDSIRNCDRRYEYRRSSSENRDLKDERKRSYKPDDSREYSSRTSSRKTYDKRSEKRCEIPHKRYTPYQGRDYNQGPHQREGHYACSERNQDFNYNYAREKNQRPSYPYRIHENERMLDSYRTNTKELPQMVNDYERFHVDHKADQINTTFPPRVNENETVSHVNEKAKTQFNENEMSVNRRANSSSEPGRADKVYREAERVQQIQQTNRSRNFHNSGKQLEDCIKERKKYPIQQNDFSFNGVRSGYEKGIPTQAVSNTSSILRSSMQEYSNQNNAANKSSIGVTILPSRNCDQNVEQDILNNNSSKENTFGAGSLDFSFQNLPSVMTDHNSYPSSEVRENHQRNIGKRDNVLDHYGDHLKSGFDINGNVCLNMDNRDDRGNISHISVCSEMEGKDLNVSQIPFSDIQPNQNIVQTRQVIQGEKLIDRKEKNEFINENQTIDPYHINENLSLIKQQCFMAHENAKTGNIENQNNKDFKNPTVDPSETDSHKLWVRSKVFDGNHPPERQNNHEAINTRKNTKTQGPVKEVCINGKDSPNQIIDFSFLRHPPPLSSIPVASTLSDTVSNTPHQPPPLDPSKKPTYETTQSQVLQPPKPEGGKPQSKTQQTKSSDLFSINLKEQTPAIPNSSKTQVTKVMETKEKPINSKVPPLPPHEIIKLTETECQDSSNIQEEKKDINNNISPSLYDSQSSEQIDRSKSEKSSAEESLNGPLEKNDTSAEPRNFRIPLKGNAESKFRPFRPWTTCSPKTKTSRKKDRGNNADQRKLDSITVNSNIEVNETEMKKLMNEISSENKLGKQSKKVTSGASNKRSSKKPKLSQKTESKRKKPKKQSHLRKLLGKSVPYLELLKLSAIAKPRVNIVLSGLTSVVNQNVDPSSLQMKSLKSCLKTNERSVADAEFHDVNKNHLKTNMEFHKLGLGNKSLLKPHGEQTSAKLHKLKSSLDLGSMENLNKIANGIKQKAKWLEKHKSMLNEVNKVKKSNGKTNQRKEHVCGTKSFRKSGKINLASLHPKMRHKIEKLSAGSPVELDEELIKTMPNVSVDIQKCDKLASTSGHGIKIDKAAFMKALNLLKNKMPAKKFVNLMKRGQFTMPTPTTFIVKPRKVVKHRAHTEVGHTDESDVENESERLDKACEAAKQRLLERRTKAGTDPPELVLEKGAKNNNLVDDENKLEIADEDNLLVNTVESDTITDSYASEMPSLWPRDEGTDSEQLNMGVKASESNMQMMGDEIICNPNVYSEAVSGGSPDTSECTNSPDTTLASELNKAYSSEMENKTTATQSNGNADKTNFSINNLIKSEKKKVSDPGESVMVKAEVYHIEHRYIERRVAVTSYPVDENEKKLCPYDSPVVTERGTDNNEYGFCEEASNALDWKRNSDDDDGYTKMEGFGSKPFIAVPLDLPDNPDEHLNLSDTMIDFGLEHMKTDETNNSPISRSHNAVSSDFIKNFQNDKEISPEMHLSEFNENLGGSFDNQNNIRFSIAQQNMFDPMIMGTNAQRENLDTNEGNMDEFIQTNNQICEESCKRNFFESIVDDVMHDEDLMKNWTEEKTETASNEYTSPLNLSPAVPECSDTSEKSTPECKTVLETEMQDYDSKNQNKVRQPVSFNEVVNKFSPFVSLEKLAHSSETGITNNDLKEKEARFISERTPLRMKDFRKRKYVKRFPVPLPRVKNKNHEQEKELYEAAKKFLGDFNDTVKRACRMKKAIKEEEKTAEVEMENGSKKPKQLHNEGMVDQPLSSQFISEIKRKQPYKSNENEGMISKAKNVKQEMIQNLTNQDTSINANVEESVKSIAASRTETSNSNLCFVKSLKKGTKRKSPILIISKGSVAKDLHDPENEVNENDIELKRIKVENMTVKKSQKSEGKERKPEKVKASIKRENSKTTKPKLDMSRWCVRCNMMFLSQVSIFFIT